MLVAPVRSRNDLGVLLADRGLVAHAVEVGTHRGDYAKMILASWPGVLYCIDPWAIHPGYEEQAKTLWPHGEAITAENRDEDYEAAKDALAEFGSRAVIIRGTSEEAISHFGDGTLDMAYLDGNHARHAVERDISLWWPKLRSGGILAGHDIVCAPGPDNWGGEIQPAVLAFAEREGVDIYLLSENDFLPWTWYAEKPA